jgi:hypothetical protein
MIVRDYEDNDFESLKKIHIESGMDYEFPNLNDPLFFVKKVVLDDEGKVIGCCVLRLEAETYLMTSGTPKMKIKEIDALTPEVENEAWMKGLSNLKATMPNWMSDKFSKKLNKLGWIPAKEGWKSWYKLLGVQ